MVEVGCGCGMGSSRGDRQRQQRAAQEVDAQDSRILTGRNRQGTLRISVCYRHPSQRVGEVLILNACNLHDACRKIHHENDKTELKSLKNASRQLFGTATQY
jgi:hypothetical protein